MESDHYQNFRNYKYTGFSENEFSVNPSWLAQEADRLLKINYDENYIFKKNNNSNLHYPTSFYDLPKTIVFYDN